MSSIATEYNLSEAKTLEKFSEGFFAAECSDGWHRAFRAARFESSTHHENIPPPPAHRASRPAILGSSGRAKIRSSCSCHIRQPPDCGGECHVRELRLLQKNLSKPARPDATDIAPGQFRNARPFDDQQEVTDP